jgi:hypothetical protein
MVYAKAVAVGVMTGLLTSVVVVAVGMLPMLTAARDVEGIQSFYVVLRPMFVFVVILGFGIGFGWTMWKARPTTRAS